MFFLGSAGGYFCCFVIIGFVVLSEGVSLPGVHKLSMNVFTPFALHVLNSLSISVEWAGFNTYSC